MRRILKYELEILDNQVLEIPSDNILSVQEQHEKVVIYALVNTESTPIKYEFSMNGTGKPVNFEINLFTFLGTVKLLDGILMFHIFYRKLG